MKTDKISFYQLWVWLLDLQSHVSPDNNQMHNCISSSWLVDYNHYDRRKGLLVNRAEFF